TLPDTADKRYPVFRLETIIQEQFKPIIDFLSYIGCDFKSTYKLCLRAVRHPFMHVSLRVASSLGAICIGALWSYCFVHTVTSGHALTNRDPAFAGVETPVVLSHLAFLILCVSIALLCFSCSSLFSMNVVRQILARERARLKTVSREFNRDDWIGVIPDLSP